MRALRRIDAESIAKVGLVVSGLVAILIAASRIAYPHDVGQYDGDVWAPADVFAGGHTPYHVSAATTPPYTVAPYGPLYYGIIAVGIRLFGDQFAFGRTLSLVGLMVTAFLVYRILRVHGRSNANHIAFLGAGLLLAQYPAQAFVGSQRSDLVALPLALGGLALVLGEGRPRATGGIVRAALAGFLVADAVLVRQTLFLPLLVGLAWYALRREGGRLLAYAATAGATLIAAFTILEATSGGGFFWHAAKLQGSVPLSVDQARQVIGSFIRSPATIFTIALLLVCAARILRRRTAPTGVSEIGSDDRLLRRLLFVYLAAAVVVAAVASAKAGSNINYWFEVCVVLAILTPLCVGEAFDLGSTRRLWSAAGLPVVFTVLIFVSAVITGGREAHGELLRWRSLSYVDEIVTKIHHLAAPHERVYVEYPDLAVAAQRAYLFNDLSLYQTSSRLLPTYRHVMGSESPRVVVSLAAVPPAGYVPVCLSHTRPTGVYAVRLYYRGTGPVATGSHCAVM